MRFSKVMLIVFFIFLSGCKGEGLQSILEPAGPEAERIARLFWMLITGASAILLGVVVLTALALTGSTVRRWLARDTAVVAGGIVFPVSVLSALIAVDFFLTRANAIVPVQEQLRISVVGEQWWWRIGYVTADGRHFQTANELRIPARVPVAVELTTADVIHSFWVPKLAGKLDMIPGRSTVLHLEASEPGVNRGQCAEYCGGPHAFMSFHVVAMEEEAFQKWLSHQASPAIPPANPFRSRGQELFLASGCGGCHAIRGSDAKGTIGPDLTHVGSRLSLAAATLPNDAISFAHWIADNQQIKPENRMPPFRLFTAAELAALSGYLASLK